ncbi:GPW/gp25 family protein [Paracandidimonas soli]
MSTGTGRAIEEMDHLRQSILQILWTRVGSRVKRRTFGSLLPELIDQPLNDYTIIQLYAATATALLMHEPRLRLTSVQLAIDADRPGAATLEISGTASLNGRRRPVSLSVPYAQGTAA